MPIFVPKDRKSLFRQFLAGMYDAVVITDPNGHILEINPRAVEYFGHGADEILDEPISLLIPGLKIEVVTRIRRGLAGDRHVVIDANGVSKTGVKIACEVAVSSIDLMNPGDLIFTIRNVERRRAFMNAFRAKANAFDLAQEALFGCDPEGNIRDCNPAFLKLFGLADIEAARKLHFADLMGEKPLTEDFAKALHGEQTFSALHIDKATNHSVLNVRLAPNLHGQKNHGVVGSIIGEIA